MSRGQDNMLRQGKTSSFIIKEKFSLVNKYYKSYSCTTIFLLYIPDPGLKLLEIDMHEIFILHFHSNSSFLLRLNNKIDILRTIAFRSNRLSQFKKTWDKLL